MKCYYHQSSDAIALCKSCHRALCTECAVDVHPGTACKERCEQDVAELNLVIERSKSMYRKTATVYNRSALVMLLCGIVFVLLGILPIIFVNSYAFVFATVLGVIFILWAYFYYNSGKQIGRVEKPNRQ